MTTPGRKIVDACKSGPQMRDCFHIRRPRGRQPAGLQPVSYRLLCKPGLAEVAGDQLRLRFKHLGKARLDGVGYAGVQLLPTLSKQAFISCVAHQRVLEDVGGCRGNAAAEDKLRGDKVIERCKSSASGSETTAASNS